MPSIPAVVATDLDGTLLGADSTISARTRAALVAAEEAGIDVVFVTARPPRWLPDFTGDVGGHGHVICLGGACLLEAATGRVLDSHGFPDDQVRELTAVLREAVPGIAFGAEAVDAGRYETAFGYDESWASIDGAPMPVRDRIEDTLGTPWPVAKFLARQTRPGLDDEDFLAAVGEAVGDSALLAFAGSPGLAELLPPGVTKASALERWCAARGVGADRVWAFGDMPNDIPMLRWAGRSFAMGNAHRDVLAAADEHAARNDEDGVARVLERVLGRC